MKEKIQDEIAELLQDKMGYFPDTAERKARELMEYYELIREAMIKVIGY